MNNNCIYVTYDINLKKYLELHGIENILYGLHPKTKNMFWVFRRDDELHRLLDLWFLK